MFIWFYFVCVWKRNQDSRIALTFLYRLLTPKPNDRNYKNKPHHQNVQMLQTNFRHGIHSRTVRELLNRIVLPECMRPSKKRLDCWLPGENRSVLCAAAVVCSQLLSASIRMYVYVCACVCVTICGTRGTCFWVVHLYLLPVFQSVRIKCDASGDGRFNFMTHSEVRTNSKPDNSRTFIEP